MVDNSEKIYAVKKRIKEGKSLRTKMLRFLKEGKYLFDVYMNDDDKRELKKGNISENVKNQFNVNRCSFSNDPELGQTKENEWNIVDGDKIYTIKNERVFKKIDERNLLDEITDIVGLRIICYFKEDQISIHNELIENLEREGEITILEKELHYPHDGLLSEDEKILIGKKNFKKSPKASMYSAIHYIVNLKKDKNEIPIEIQVRTMFEEAFGELEHDISYKYFPTKEVEKFKSVGGLTRELDHQVQGIKKEIVEKKKKIEKKIKHHFHEIDVETLDKIFKMMSTYRIGPSSMLNLIEKIFKDLDPVFYWILRLDKGMILSFLCFEYGRERLEGIEEISKHTLIREFFDKLDELIEKKGIKKCEEILEYLSYVSDSKIINVWLKGCKKNIEVIRKHHLTKKVNDRMFEIFSDTFIENDKGLLEHENLLSLLVEIWDWIEDERENWKENIISYVKNSSSENSAVIISYLLYTFYSYYAEGKISDSGFYSFLSQILEEASHKENGDISKKCNNIRRKMR
jgi:ppGpp synthetase/RelA/SpoT-type nucleotidyltranferase